MKTWIIIISTLVVVLYLVAKGLANYIKNDQTARVEYWLTQGTSGLGIAHTIISFVLYLAFIADIVLLLIYFL